MGIENDIRKMAADIRLLTISINSYNELIGEKLDKLLEEKEKSKVELNPNRAKSLSHIQHSKCCSSLLYKDGEVTRCKACKKLCEIMEVQDY